MTARADPPADAPVLVWLRNDLRLSDNPALAAATETGRPVVVTYLLDEESPNIRPLGGAARWWLHHSLSALASELEKNGGRLTLRRGPADAEIQALAKDVGAAGDYWNRRYDPAGTAVDTQLKSALKDTGRDAKSFKATVLFEPWEVQTGAGEPYRVYTPFMKACRNKGLDAAAIAAPRVVHAMEKPPATDRLEDWALLPVKPDWAGGLRDAWRPGEQSARARLEAFVEHALTGYAKARDFPGEDGTSRLSPSLRFGEISPRQILAALGDAAEGDDGTKFVNELIWREFCAGLLHHFPKLPDENFQTKFDAFPWRNDTDALAAWRKGRTGYPIVDAGMRQLWRTGWMHNRVRMIVGSFLVKHLLLDWRLGEAWFWDTLVDADPANNAAGWQWIAGSGADAAPYFRVFNPVLQGEKFDPDGAYVRRWVPELSELPDTTIHAPWTAAPLERAACDYPDPIIEHRHARARALDAYEAVKSAA